MSGLGGMIGQWADDFSHSAVAGQLVEALGPRVLQGVVDQLNSNGLGAKVNSWLGNGDNQPLSPAELQAALGSQQLKDLAAKLGIPVDKVADVLARSLPAAVDHASPGGTIAPDGAAPTPPSS